MFRQGMSLRASEITEGMKTWSLVRLHFQFQAVIVQPFDMADGTLQPTAFNVDDDGFGFFEIFRQGRRDPQGEAEGIVFDGLQAHRTVDAAGHTAKECVQTIVQMRRAADGRHVYSPRIVPAFATA